MKKLLSLILAAALCLGISSCGKSDEKTITVSDAPGMGIRGIAPGKITYLA